MTITSGKDMLLRVDDGAGGYSVVGGLRTRTFSVSAGTVDVTHSDSGAWRELLPDAGVRQVNVSGNGLFVDDSAAERARTILFDGVATEWQLTVPSYGTFAGPFQVTNLDYAGEYRGESTFSISLASAGEITFAPEVPA